MPDTLTSEIRWAARAASYGWGVVPVTATIAGLDFTTSLMPRDGGYLLPLKLAVQRHAGILLGDDVSVRLRVYPATAARK